MNLCDNVSSYDRCSEIIVSSNSVVEAKEDWCVPFPHILATGVATFLPSSTFATHPVVTTQALRHATFGGQAALVAHVRPASQALFVFMQGLTLA